MPIYEYLCSDCGQRFERLVRAWGESVCCPKCQSPEVEKLLSSFAMASSGSAGPPAPARAGGGGGCCGGGCGCAHR